MKDPPTVSIWRCPVTGRYICVCNNKNSIFFILGGNAISTGDSTDGCQPGYFCPEGSPAPVDCPAGMYCGGFRKSEPTNNCSAGHFCPPRSTNSSPTSCVNTGNYCPAGIPEPIPCPNGTYGPPGDTMDSINSCKPCDAGFYCNGVGRINASGECFVGFFCPQGSTVPDAPHYECPAGYHCPAGSGQSLQCENGFYQNETRMGACETCPPGYYCPIGVPVSSPIICPAGYYCLQGTNLETRYPCPPGTYNDKTGRVSEGECLPCSPGYYCSSGGAASGTGDGPCPAGFYCPANTSSSTQYPCEAGYYCESNRSSPSPCPRGTFSATTMNPDVSYCLNCSAGKYCEEASTEGKNCDAGFICTGGSDTPTPTDPSMGYRCPLGHKCESGDTAPQACSPGQYQNEIGQSNCEFCPPRFVCPTVNTTNPLPCPAGAYCMGNTSLEEKCPPGKYSNVTGRENESECLDCPAGK